ncbi:hypothetical protein FB451DRAFT_1226793, partial [Mycena latifolia]
KSNIATSTADRISLVAAALDTAIDRLGADGQLDGEPWGTTGNLFSQMAEFDIATNQTKYENVLVQSFGHAAAKAYAAYKNPVFLPYAVESWWNGRARTLSDTDVSSGKISGKTFSVLKTCPNATATTVGGTFWNTDPMEPSVAGVATGVSALLAEATSDPMYLQAAIESADFIHSHLCDIRNIVQDYIAVATGNDKECHLEIVSAVTPSSSGLMIEGLAILASITNSSSTQMLRVPANFFFVVHVLTNVGYSLNDLLVAVIPHPLWQRADGVIIGSSGTGDMNLLQGLGAAYTRNFITPALRQYIGAYIAVQFNAVIDLAASRGSNIYGGAWTGPPSAAFSGFNQTMALAALISAMSVGNDSAAPSSSSASTPTGTVPVGVSPSPSPSKKGYNPGAIVGGVFGVVAVIVVFGLWLLRRRRSRAPKTPSLNSAHVEPFMASALDSFPVSSPTGVRVNKRGLTDSPLSPSGIPPTAIRETGASAMNSSSAPPAPEVERHPDSTLPTEALVELLNRRLRNRQWDDGETPPDYPVTGAVSQR